MASTPAQSLTLISTGLADPRLQPARGNPDAAQFVKVVRKTTRWAAQWNRVEFDGSAEFGQRVSMTLPRIGHLISGITIAVTMPDIYTTQLRAIQAAGGTSLTNKGTFLGPLFGWTNSLGHALIQQIELEIGGAIVETLDSRLLEIMDELYEPLEGVLTKNRMIKRAPSGFNETSWLSSDLTKLFIPIPFWFSRRGIYSHALPIQALTSDIVRVHVTLRPIEELVYTSARPDPRNPAIPTVVDGKYEIRGSRFYRSATGESALSLYSFNASMPITGLSGELIPAVQMPPRFSPVDAYALVEYIFLEEFEALAFRTGELTYHVEQHFAVPVVQTLGMKEIRVNLPYANPVKELFWVLQRPEVAQYNAWFLFTRDLAPVVSKIPPSDGVANPCLTPWWPDAALVPAADRAWCIRPGFQTSRSEPLEGVTLMYNSYERAVHDGGSFYRGVVPAMYYTKSAAINRYVYAYSFGARAADGVYEPTGVANWDKIPRKEMYLRLTNERGYAAPPNMNLYVYVTIWNVFKVFGGRGGMLFTN